MKSYSQALKILKENKIKINDEKINSSESLNRVSSVNIYTNLDYPSANNASFDGYAIKSKDTNKLDNKIYQKFKIVGSIAAGDKPIKKKIKKFETVEIMTGALIPKSFDAIIPVEQINFYPNKKKAKYILLNKKVPKFEYVRFKGSDYKKGDLLISKGTILQSSHILALKILGIKKIRVKKIPNILFFSTGNEITDQKKIPNWKIRNSNSHYINSLKKNFLFNFNYGGIMRDKDANLFAQKIKRVINSKIDIIITSGAVSAGKFDFVPSVVRKLSLSNYFKGVAIRPGKPILFAKIKGKQKAIFGLPGNPMSSSACFRFFVFPYLLNILHVDNERPLKAVMKNSFTKKKEFTRFVRSKINTTKNGKIEVKVLKDQESFRIKPFLNCNVWAVLSSGKSLIKKGEVVDCFFPNYSNNNLI